MARVKGALAARKKHKKVLKLARGYRGARSKQYRIAKQSVMQAQAYAFAGRISAVVGTHTHVQTADERIVNGTAAISDLGMCGAYTSVLGRDVKEIVTRFTTEEKTRYTIAEGPGIFCGVFFAAC